MVHCNCLECPNDVSEKLEWSIDNLIALELKSLRGGLTTYSVRRQSSACSLAPTSLLIAAACTARSVLAFRATTFLAFGPL